MSFATSVVSATLRPAVFLFPGLSGDQWELNAIRDGCGSGLRFVSISYLRWTVLRRDSIDLKGLVAHCVAQIEMQAPDGLILLAGYSFGGHVAFAVAAALRASRRYAVRLYLLDTATIPAIERKRRRPIQQIWRLITSLLKNKLSVNLGQIIGRRLARRPHGWLLDLTERLLDSNTTFEIAKQIDVELQMLFCLRILWEILDWMAELTTPFSFDSILFRCAEQEVCLLDDLGWRRYLNRLQIIPVSGNHFNLLDTPNDISFCRLFMAAVHDDLVV